MPIRKKPAPGVAVGLGRRPLPRVRFPAEAFAQAEERLDARRKERIARAKADYRLDHGNEWDLQTSLQAINAWAARRQAFLFIKEEAGLYMPESLLRKEGVIQHFAAKGLNDEPEEGTVYYHSKEQCETMGELPGDYLSDMMNEYGEPAHEIYDEYETSDPVPATAVDYLLADVVAPRH